MPAPIATEQTTIVIQLGLADRTGSPAPRARPHRGQAVLKRAASPA
jgi:hypothetical protein